MIHQIPPPSQTKRGVDWKFDLMNALGARTTPRVLTAADFHLLAQTVRNGVSEVTARAVAASFEKVGALRAVNTGLYLNRRALPPAEPFEAARYVRSDAVISLHTVLAAVGAHNNPTTIISAVVPQEPGRRLNLGMVPPKKEGEPLNKNWQFQFQFVALDPRFFEKVADPKGDDLVYARGKPAPTFSPEAALLQWIHLSKQHRSALTRPPVVDIVFKPTGASKASPGLSRQGVEMLAARWDMSAVLNEWLAEWSVRDEHRDSHYEPTSQLQEQPRRRMRP